MLPLLPASSSPEPTNAAAGHPTSRTDGWFRIGMAATVALLVAAGIFGWQMSRRAAVPPSRHAYETRLQLSRDELEALRPVVSTADADMARIRRELRSQMTTTTRELNAVIAKDLSPARPASPPVENVLERKPKP